MMSRMKLDEVQTIAGPDGRPTHAVVPWPTWTAIAQAIDSDEALFRSVPADEETFPLEVAARLVAGDSPIKVFREHRRLTQAALAQRVGSTPAYLSQIESGARRAGDDLLRLIARALGVDYEDIALSAAPDVRAVDGQRPTSNEARRTVWLPFSIKGRVLQVAVPWEVLRGLEGGGELDARRAAKAFERHRQAIEAAAARAIAEGRRQREGTLLLVAADF